MNAENFRKAYGKLVEKAWLDEEFKARLLADPVTVFKENGIEVPEGIELRVLEDTDKIRHLTLPRQPKGAELSPEQWEVIIYGERKDEARRGTKGEWN